MSKKPSVKKVVKHLVPSDSYSETIEINPTTKEYMIKRTYIMYLIYKDTITDEWVKKSLLKKEVAWFPLSHWGFCKEVKGVVVVFRVMEKRDITEQQELIYYSIPITYKIREHERTKNIYLKAGTAINTQYIGRRTVIKRKYATVALRYVAQDMAFPLHTILEKDLPDAFPYSYIEIKLGKGKEISKDRVDHLMDSGQVFRITDPNFRRRILL